MTVSSNESVLSDCQEEVLHESQLTLIDKDKTCVVYLFLFTNILLLCRQKKENKKGFSLVGSGDTVQYPAFHRQPGDTWLLSVCRGVERRPNIT